MIDRIHSQQMIQDREICYFACSATALVAGLEMMIRPDFDRWRWNVNELSLRKGEENDRQALYQVLAANQMESDHDPGEYLVALIDGTLVGTVRLEWEGQSAYLRQMSVAAEWQMKGVGRALVRALARGLPELNVVSRGSSAGFYSRLGFQPMSWERVPDRYRQECATCPNYEQCQPLPMILNAPASNSGATPF